MGAVRVGGPLDIKAPSGPLGQASNCCLFKGFTNAEPRLSGGPLRPAGPARRCRRPAGRPAGPRAIPRSVAVWAGVLACVRARARASASSAFAAGVFEGPRGEHCCSHAAFAEQHSGPHRRPSAALRVGRPETPQQAVRTRPARMGRERIRKRRGTRFPASTAAAAQRRSRTRCLSPSH